MSIILRALKKVQEQEAAQGLGSLSSEAPSSGAAPSALAPSRGRGVSSDAKRKRSSRSHSAAAQATPRHSFGPGLRVLLGLLIVLGIATTGWFANRIYLNLRAEKEIAKEPAPVAAEETAQHMEAVTQRPTPSESATPEPVPASAPAVAPEPVASQPQPPVAAVAPKPQRASASLAQPASQPAQPVPAPPPVEIEVPPVEVPEPREAPAAMEEPKPVKSGRPEFKINAIAWQNEEPRAIVNMQRVYEGDVIDGATVVAIKRKVVVFEYEGEIFEVRF